MIIVFGLELDDLVVPINKDVYGGVHHFGPNGLLFMLESHLGLIGNPINNDYLRIEQYRQAILRHLEFVVKEDSPFYSKSFEADQFATATNLLTRRDELLLSGWNFERGEEIPERLKVLSEIESLFSQEPPNEDLKKLELSPGYSDRFFAVIQKLENRRHPIRKVLLNEPLNKLPKHFQILFSKLKTLTPDLIIENLEQAFNHSQDLDLDKLKSRFSSAQGKKGKLTLKNDGSLLIIQSKRATDAGAFLAKLLKLNPDYKPSCIIPEKNRALDIAMVQEGIPSMGIQSASLARPSLQILKLATVFLWQPIDPFKILEFVSLSIKPLEDTLANAIANQIAQTPGLNSESWHITINRYFDDLSKKAIVDSSINVNKIRDQYKFWFERRRYDLDKVVPKGEVIEIFNYLWEWSFKLFEENGGKNNSLLVLSEQSKRIKELLEVLPETSLNYLELERIVRTIYEPSPVIFQQREKHHLPYVMSSSAIIGKVEKVLWWNFIENEPVHFFSRWYQKERKYLNNQGIVLVEPQQENELLIWQRRRPFIHAQNQMVLVLPEMVDGRAVHPHPLFGDLEATFENLEDITIDLDKGKGYENFEPHFQLPEVQLIPNRQLGRPKPFLNINNLQRLSERDYETLTSLETLFYYPYQWMFRYKIKLNKSSILSVVKDNTLMGNLAHRLFEKLFSTETEIKNWTQDSLNQWIEKQSDSLLRREGAVLLMYGREPERIAFVNKLKYAAWSLVSTIQKNNWEIQGSESDLQGDFEGKSIKGRADLVLKKEDELAVVDLKWRGAKRRERIIRNKEDLQLVLYSKLLTEDDSWAHTSFFIIENGKLIARNNLAFKEVISIDADSNHEDVNREILDKMEKTYKWRMEQLEKGKIEIRCSQTYLDLEDEYANSDNGLDFFDLLEMKDKDAPFDDYQTLINLIK